MKKNRGLATANLLLILTLSVTACSSLSSASGTDAQGSYLGQRTKTSGCRVNGALQDSACTPGAVITTATKDQICQPGYARDVRDVSESEKDRVYTEYGLTSHKPGEFEVDHLVPLELGGSNDIANLWPEAASPRPGFHEKDRVESYLHQQVCSGAMALEDAQRNIATNWLVVYEGMPPRSR